MNKTKQNCNKVRTVTTPFGYKVKVGALRNTGAKLNILKIRNNETYLGIK